jgi:parallel beta-helix repeat protein
MRNNSKASMLTKFVTATYLLSGLGATIALPNSSAVAATPVDNAGDCSAAKDIGSLINKVAFKDFVGSFDSEDCYKFTMTVSTPASIFLNGLSAGTQIQLLDSNKTVLKTSTNQGTTWSSPTQTGTTGGSITRKLNAGTYYVRVSSATITGNPLYKKQDDSYSLNLIPHNALKTVIVAASNTASVTGSPIPAHYTATGMKDQDVINQAIKSVGESGGGTVLLLEGTYNISDNVYVTYDNVTLSGVGWGTKLRLADNTKLGKAGMLRSAHLFSEDRRNVPRFSNQNFLHMSLDGNKGNGTNFTNGYANFGTYLDSSFEDVRAHDFPHYGFDPHEQSDTGTATLRLTIKDSLADHNAVDGMTTDTCIDSTFSDNVVDSNTRHGINIVTASQNNTYMNNVVTNNGSNGITVQPGSDLTKTSNGNKLIGNVTKFNKGDGIYIYRASNTEVSGNIVASNGKYGIRNRASTLSLITNNTIDDNGQLAANTYPAIYLHGDTLVFSTNNLIQNNLVRASAPDRYKWGIAEGEARDDYNTFDSNTIQGVNKPFRLQGANSTNTNNQVIP